MLRYRSLSLSLSLVRSIDRSRSIYMYGSRSRCLCFQVKVAYVNFVNHCYVDTEVEMKEIYTSNHIWQLFEDFTVDMARVGPAGDGSSSPRSSSPFHPPPLLASFLLTNLLPSSYHLLSSSDSI